MLFPEPVSPTNTSTCAHPKNRAKTVKVEKDGDRRKSLEALMKCEIAEFAGEQSNVGKRWKVQQ